MTTMTPDGDLELRSRVPATAAGLSLIEYLLQRFCYHDRATWLREIADGRVCHEDRVLAADAVMATGMRLTYRRTHHEPPVDTNVEVLHHDDALVVVRKPAHLPMHADGPFVRHTLIHLARTRLGRPDLHLVHRLDRETSGLCVLAQTAPVRDALRQQFASGSVHKAYLAVVRGRVAGDFAVDLPIGRSRHSEIALRRAAGTDAEPAEQRPARTVFRLLRRSAERSLLRCEPQTGRTHQIRVHLEAAGHPLLGDKLYGRPDADYLAFVARVKAGGLARDVAPGEPDRQLLHAAELAFVHPRSGATVRFVDPLPSAFESWLDPA